MLTADLNYSGHCDVTQLTRTETDYPRMKITNRLLFTFLIVIAGCSSQYVNQNPVGQAFPSVSGQSLEQIEHQIPNYFAGRTVLLLIGFKQDSQFDIDRWLIGLDMTETQVEVYELPTIQGMFPRMFRTQIDNGMRAGIPKELWKGVITIYADGEVIQAFTGNQNPNNARCIVLDAQGKVIFFYDRGFSVSALNALRSALNKASRVRTGFFRQMRCGGKFDLCWCQVRPGFSTESARPCSTLR